MTRPLAPTLALLLLALGCPAASADLIELSSGQVLEGIVTHQTDRQVKIRVASHGFITIDRSAVESIVETDSADHQRLLEQWRQEALEVRQRAADEAEADAAQRKKGLAKYRRIWMTPADRAEAQEKESAARLERLRAQRSGEIEQLERRIEALEDENTYLRRQLDGQTSVFLVPSAPYPVHSPAPGLTGPDVYRDERGREVRVESDHGLRYFVGADGQRVHVVEDRGNMIYTDRHGQRQELTPAGR
jgi:hypothetical protein